MKGGEKGERNQILNNRTERQKKHIRKLPIRRKQKIRCGGRSKWEKEAVGDEQRTFPESWGPRVFWLGSLVFLDIRISNEQIL